MLTDRDCNGRGDDDDDDDDVNMAGPGIHYPNPRKWNALYSDRKRILQGWISHNKLEYTSKPFAVGARLNSHFRLTLKWALIAGACAPLIRTEYRTLSRIREQRFVIYMCGSHVAPVYNTSQTASGCVNTGAYQRYENILVIQTRVRVCVCVHARAQSLLKFMYASHYQHCAR